MCYVCMWGGRLAGMHCCVVARRLHRLLEEIPHELLATIALEAYGPCVRTFPLFAQPPQLQEAIAIRLRRRSLMLGVWL